VLFIHDYIHERLRGTEQYGKALAAYDMIELVKVSDWIGKHKIWQIKSVCFEQNLSKTLVNPRLLRLDAVQAGPDPKP
jgi:hypothetical protein